MNRIVLTAEQAELLNPLELVEICDPDGVVVTSIPPVISLEKFAQVRRARDCMGPFSGAEVQQMLLTLDEVWQREGPFGEKRMREIISSRNSSS
jgi:hypothetical protein